jgi:hypothetical protein
MRQVYTASLHEARPVFGMNITISLRHGFRMAKQAVKILKNGPNNSLFP